MKRKLRRMASFCMTVVLLLSSVVWAPAAGAEGENVSLERAEIEVLEVCQYDGREWQPKIRVSLDEKTLIEGVDYTVNYRNNVKAGNGVVTVVGIGIYYGSQKEELFPIEPRRVKESKLHLENVIQKAYDGKTTATPEIELETLFDDDVVEVTYEKAEYDTPYVGANKVVTVSGISFAGPDGDKYVLENPALTLKADIGQITAVSPKLEKSASLAKGQSLDLKQLISNTWKGEVSFDIGEESLNCSLTEDGILTAGQTTGTVCILANMQPLDVNGDNVPEYTSGIGYLNLTIVDKETQETFEVIGPESVTYGTLDSFYTVGGSGSGGVTFSVQEEIGTGEADIDPKTGKLTPEKVGTVYVSCLLYTSDAADD